MTAPGQGTRPTDTCRPPALRQRGYDTLYNNNGLVLIPAFAKRNWDAPLGLALFLVVMAAFLPALDGGFISLDDGLFVTRNPHVMSGLNSESIRWAFSNTEAANWHPLTWLSHMIDCQIFGLRPRGHHFTSVLLHALNSLLLFWILARLTGSTWRSLSVAGLFALHPLRVESVTWIAERKDVLCAFFFLLAVLAYQQYTGKSAAGNRKPKPASGGATKPQFQANRPSVRDQESEKRRSSSPFYFLSLILFVLALMSKPMAVTLPFVLLLLDYWPLRRFETTKSQQNNFLFLEKLPFLALAAGVSAITLLAQRSAGAITIEGLPFMARMANALISYCRYLGKIFWPANLSVFYPYIEKGLAPAAIGASLLLIAFTAFAFLIRKQRPYIFIGWFWFGITLAPVIGIVQVGAQSMADRYTYLPSIGILILLTWSVCDLAKRFRQQTLTLSIATTITLLTSGALTREQLGYWRDSETLFRHAIAATKDNWMAHCNLGIALNHKGQLAEAITEFRESLASNPNYAVARQNLGAALLVQGALDQAIPELEEAVKLKPGYALAHCNLGAALKRAGRLDEAIVEFQQALKYLPNDAESHYDLGVALKIKGRLDEAISEFQEALRCDPSFSKASQSLQETLQQRNALP